MYGRFEAIDFYILLCYNSNRSVYRINLNRLPRSLTDKLKIMKKMLVLCQIALAFAFLVGCKTKSQVVTYPPSVIQIMKTPEVIHREKAVLPGMYSLGVAPSQTETATNGIVWERHLKELQLMQFEHERELVAMEYEAKKREYARQKGLPLEPSPVPPQQQQPPKVQKQKKVVVVYQQQLIQPVGGQSQQPPPQNNPTQNGVWVGGFYP
jgi:hypothetical protein